MKVLIPTPITAAMLASSTIAEPAAGETAWVSAGTYAVGDLRIRTTTHRIYQCVTAHSGRTALPENDPTYWLDYGPTARWALFDNQVSTQSSIVTPLTVVLRPGFFNAMALYGLDGATLAVTVKDAPGGSVVHSETIDLTVPPLDWYDWAFGQIKPLTKAVLSGLTPYPDAELTITITAAAGVTVKAGMLVVGDFVSLVGDGDGDFGGTTYGATAEPVDFSYIKTDDFGNTSIVKRRNATDMRVKVVLPKSSADQALEIVQSVLSVPCAWIATEAAGYAGLNVFGLGSGSLSYEGPNHAELSLYVKGLV